MGYSDPDATLEAYTTTLYRYAAQAGFSGRLPTLIEEEYETQGLSDIVSMEYTNLSKPELNPLVQDWFKSTTKALLPVAWKRQGHSKEEIESQLHQLDGDIESSFNEGLVPDMRLGSVLVRKPS